MKIRKSFQVEINRFEKLGLPMVIKNEIGLKQFFDKESKGIIPENSDAYFDRLCNGKMWWEVTLNMYREDYLKEGGIRWPGWLYIEEQFKNDPQGLRQIKDRVRPKQEELKKMLGIKDE